MKIRSVARLFLLLLSVLLLLTSCGNSDDEAPDGEDVSHYTTAIATLEAELKQQKESFYIKEAAYKAEIEKLQQQLSTLGTTEKDDPSELVFRYRVENGEAVITGYSGSATLLSIPSTLDGYPVVGLGERVFENASIAAVVLPEGVREIGWFAFYGCRSLVNVTIPSSVTSIGYAVFDGCTQLHVFCPADSYAEQYAKSYGLSCITS